MKKGKRIYYVPGTISLVLLPVLCYFYLSPYLKINERVLPFQFCTVFSPGDPPQIKYDTSFLDNTDNRRIHTVVRLNGNRTNDESKLKYLESRLNEIRRSKDTIHGIHLIFSDSVKYGHFVEAFNTCLKIDGISTYYYENNIWAFYQDSEKRAFQKLKATHEKLTQEKRYRKMENYKYQLPLRDRITQTWKVWPIFLAVLILMYLSVRHSRK